MKPKSINNPQIDITDPEALLNEAGRLDNKHVNRSEIISFLALGHERTVNHLFDNHPLQSQWLIALIALIKKSNYHVGRLLEHRTRLYPDDTLFQVIRGNEIIKYSYQESWDLICQINLALNQHLKSAINPVIGIYTPNSIEGALIDLACLSFGHLIVPVPPNSSEQQLKFIIEHAGITHLFIGGNETVNLYNKALINKNLKLVVLPRSQENLPDSLPWESFLNLAATDQISELPEIDMDGISTVMYTSGTTADPKGIIFTQMNMISKRFARALALPDIGHGDVFLCYLPLFHTFGRYLEMMGAIFWGATYTFAVSPTFHSLLKEFPIIKPSVLISIPKRWMQLYTHISTKISLETESPDTIRKTVRMITGGRLKWGLSAAGYLDPDIFIFFQKYGINILSGYGMTETTGGITMTPPGDYQRDSVGKPLPGIELKLAEDGELLLQGPYVSPGYFNNTAVELYTKGWFKTGDIFKLKQNHYHIIDRKKEIYKNSRGQTISPQKIENMFRDFDSVKSVFLVGDGKEYNILLIFPDPDTCPIDLKTESEEAVREFFSSLIQSVNSFLAPFERIVNFNIIPRDFSQESGELTPKKTVKRKIILSNFAKYIDPLYEKDFISLIHQQYEIRLPKWFLREKNAIPSDISWDGKILSLGKSNDSIPFIWKEKKLVIGDFHYECQIEIFDLLWLFCAPELWVGNHSFVLFTGETVYRKYSYNVSDRIKLRENRLDFSPKPELHQIIQNFSKTFRKIEPNRQSLHTASRIIQHGQGYDVEIALKHIDNIAKNNQTKLSKVAIHILHRMRFSPSSKLRMKAIEYLLPHISGESFVEMLLDVHNFTLEQNVPDEISLDARLLRETHFQSMLAHCKYLRDMDNKDLGIHRQLIQSLLAYISDYGILHPRGFTTARAELIWWYSICRDQQIKIFSKTEYDRLISGFRNWLGDPFQMAIDRDSGEELFWHDVLIFDQDVSEKDQSTLQELFEQTSILREAVFLLSQRRLIQLEDIPKGGVWITCIGNKHGKRVFRILVQTRDHSSYNFAINMNIDIDNHRFLDEINWLIITGSPLWGPKLVEDFGGYWDQYNLYTEEYIHGETLIQYLVMRKDEIAAKTAIDRWHMRWLHFIWNGVMAYLDFWRRTRYEYGFNNPSPTNVIIPEFDYATGTRLISISGRESINRVADIFLSIYSHFILETEQQFPGLKRMADWEMIFESAMQVLSVKEGIKILLQLSEEISQPDLIDSASKYGLNPERIHAFVQEVNVNGVLTKQIVFSTLRYERWLELNPGVTLEARGSILQELYKDYHVGELLEDYPESRIRFFLMTCFKDSPDELKSSLLTLQKNLRSKSITLEDLDAHLHSIRETKNLSMEDEYFLTRMLFEHLDAHEKGELIPLELGTGERLDLITIIDDKAGETYRIRPPFQPKEIAKFLSILRKVNLHSIFKEGHEFLIIANTNNRIIGGVFWKVIHSNNAYIERVALLPEYQKKHLSIRLLEELFNRLRRRRLTHVSVGYFQAGLFYKLGFQIDKKFGGLIKQL